MVTIGSGAKPAAKSQVILPTPSIPESENIPVKKKVKIPRCPTCGIIHPPPYCEKPAQKQEIQIPVSEISSLLKSARIKYAHHVPKCPHCGKCSPSFTWDGRFVRVYYNECREAFDWDPSPSWLVIMKVEKWVSETRGSNGH